MNVNGFEIEHKYLIAMPDKSLLAEGERSSIVQTYLLGEEGTTERVRARSYADRTEYTHTTKMKISAVRRIEQEEIIAQEEYEKFLTRADPARRPIEKQRFCLPYEGHTLEIDVYPFWSGHAILEVELEDERQSFSLPPEIRVVREVSDDPRYTNAALSLEIPNPNED